MTSQTRGAISSHTSVGQSRIRKSHRAPNTRTPGIAQTQRTGLIDVTASRRFAAQAAEEARQHLERMASERLQAGTAVDGLFKAKVVDNSAD